MLVAYIIVIFYIFLQKPKEVSLNNAIWFVLIYVNFICHVSFYGTCSYIVQGWGNSLLKHYPGDCHVVSGFSK